MAFAGWGKKLGSLIVAVNVVGSLFYGSLLGCFVLAFGFRRVRGTATFIGMLAGEAAIFWTFFYARVSYLWYNVIGCVVVVGTALAITYLAPSSVPPPPVPCRQNSRRGRYSSVSIAARSGEWFPAARLPGRAGGVLRETRVKANPGRRR